MQWRVFCFFKQKTAYEMRISDWSSDVCSSDLIDAAVSEHAVAKIRDAIPRVKTQAPVATIGAEQIEDAAAKRIIHVDAFTVTTQARLGDTQIGRASCRERVCQYV